MWFLRSGETGLRCLAAAIKSNIWSGLVVKCPQASLRKALKCLEESRYLDSILFWRTWSATLVKWSFKRRCRELFDMLSRGRMEITSTPEKRSNRLLWVSSARVRKNQSLSSCSRDWFVVSVMITSRGKVLFGSEEARGFSSQEAM